MFILVLVVSKVGRLHTQFFTFWVTQQLERFFFDCAGASLLYGLLSRCSEEGGYSLVAVGRLLIGVASLVVEHWALGRLGFRRCSSRALEPRLSSGGARAWLLRSM